MKSFLGILLTAVFVVSLGEIGIAQKPGVKQEEALKVTAKVEAIDLSKRIVTLRNADGYVFALRVGEEARNLDRISVGDKVTATYYESVALQVRKPGKEVNLASQTIERAKPGESPGGVLVNHIIVTATIEQINPKKDYVTLKGPDGGVIIVRVQDPANLENVDVGDQVEVTYTQAVAIAVEKP